MFVEMISLIAVINLCWYR